jgi:hypothetical protein
MLISIPAAKQADIAKNFFYQLFKSVVLFLPFLQHFENGTNTKLADMSMMTTIPILAPSIPLNSVSKRGSSPA